MYILDLADDIIINILYKTQLNKNKLNILHNCCNKELKRILNNILLADKILYSLYIIPPIVNLSLLKQTNRIRKIYSDISLLYRHMILRKNKTKPIIINVRYDTVIHALDI